MRFVRPIYRLSTCRGPERPPQLVGPEGSASTIVGLSSASPAGPKFALPSPGGLTWPGWLPHRRWSDRARPRLRGVHVNALELIKTDHDRLKKLFDDALDNDEPTARESVLHAIRSELMAHERME